MVNVLQESAALLDYTVGIRRHLHTYPEPTSKEFNTVKLIISELTKAGIPYENIPDGGVLGIIEGKVPGKTILLRADCDALLMQESPNNLLGPKTCVSQVDGVAHMCGHDSHTAMLLATGRILLKHRDQLEGRVILLFERGEEGGNNIYYVMKHIQQQNIRIDGCWALHIDPFLNKGLISLAPGPNCGGNLNFEIKLTGKGGHASRPDRANNPIDCFVAIATGIKELRMRYIDPTEPLTVSLGMVQGGTRRNVIPESLEFAGTVRFFNGETGRIYREELRKVITKTAEIYGCEVEFQVFSGPSLPVVTQEQCYEIARDAVSAALGEDYVTVKKRSLGTESFATLTAYYPGVAANVGVRNEEKGIVAGVHHPQFDMDEDALQYGIAANVAYAIAFLRNKEELEFTPFPGDADEVLRYTNRPVPPRYDEVEVI
ncbi:M20 metallopeptidase family protein [Paenibacillus senegalimassiliensis]|uniref:M20 metallopeptidase family protein n=1 Tax=Paenibacillus senegalimassiliensis TaxID=1737426 RepID=UPI00073EEE04|nr:amidohydrolase [Paenibacillus senegalimassiliensis]